MRTYEQIKALVSKQGRTRWHRREHVFGVKQKNGEWMLLDHTDYFNLVGVSGEGERGLAYKALDDLGYATDKLHAKYEYLNEVALDPRVKALLQK